MIYKKQVVKIAIFSRFLVFIIQYLSNHLIEDHVPDVFRYPTEVKNSIYDKVVQNLFGGFLRWDAQYFMHVAKNGYTYENSMAFFPLFPVIIRLISEFLQNFIPFLNIDSILLLVFIAFNYLFFIKSVVVLYELSEIILYPSIAYKTAVLFSFNPASVFFSAPYSETLFSYLTFKGILNCLKFYQKYSDKSTGLNATDMKYVIPISLSTCTRSNGILNIGFFLYTLVCLFLKNYPVKLWGQFIFILKYIFMTVFYSIVGSLPFILYQEFCYDTFCKSYTNNFPDYIKSYAELRGYVLQGEHYKHNQTWCNENIPLAYSYVQSYYWNVGFLKYYKFKQIPNFLLASPILALIIFNCLIYLKNNLSLNILNIFSFNKIYEKSKTLNILHEPTLFVFVIHSLTFSIFCLFCIHVQVSTRMLCSSTPFIYWVCAYYLQNIDFRSFSDILFINKKHCTFIEKLIMGYFIFYFIGGTILFCNYLPFT